MDVNRCWKIDNGLNEFQPWHGLTQSIVISNPVTVSCPNLNLLKWRVMPLQSHKWSQSTVWKNLLCKSSDQRRESSTYLVMFCTSWGDAALQWNFITTKFPMVWWEWWNDGHIYKGEYCNDHFNSQKNFPFCSC